MKYTCFKIIILFVALLSTMLFAQDNGNIDIKAKVKAQMLKAQSSMVMADKQSEAKSSDSAFPNISSGVFNGLIFILLATIILSLVFLRRVKIQEKEVSRQFKENIRLLREENLRQPINYSLTPVRQSLISKISGTFEESTITILARKLKIAKGEILLANNIKNYASENNYVRNKA